MNVLEFVLDIHPDEAKEISEGYFEDRKLAPIIKRLENSVEDSLHDRYFWNSENKRLYLTITTPHRLCISEGPLRLTLIQESHDCLTAVHPARDRTYSKHARYFYWPNMGKDVKEFVKSCDRCQRCKGGRQQEGLLLSLPVPSHPWEDISMDMIVGLPSTKGGQNTIFMFVDRLTKMVHLVPTTSTWMPEELHSII